jgi:hypothetical protein
MEYVMVSVPRNAVPDQEPDTLPPHCGVAVGEGGSTVPLGPSGKLTPMNSQERVTRPSRGRISKKRGNRALRNIFSSYERSGQSQPWVRDRVFKDTTPDVIIILDIPIQGYLFHQAHRP